MMRQSWEMMMMMTWWLASRGHMPISRHGKMVSMSNAHGGGRPAGGGS